MQLNPAAWAGQRLVRARLRRVLASAALTVKQVIVYGNQSRDLVVVARLGQRAHHELVDPGLEPSEQVLKPACTVAGALGVVPFASYQRTTGIVGRPHPNRSFETPLPERSGPGGDPDARAFAMRPPPGGRYDDLFLGAHSRGRGDRVIRFPRIG